MSCAGSTDNFHHTMTEKSRECTNSRYNAMVMMAMSNFFPFHSDHTKLGHARPRAGVYGSGVSPP